MKIYAALLTVFLFVFSVYPQVVTLDEKLSVMHKQNFPEWKPENTEKAFYPMISNTWKFNPQHHKLDEVSDLHSIWVNGKKRVNIMMSLVNSEQIRFNFNMFITRNISPPSYKIDDLGDEAYLVKFHDRVEIAFVKYNVFTQIFYSFPSKYKKPLNIYHSSTYNAPKEEVEFAVKAARLIAAEIDNKQTIETLTGVKTTQTTN